MREINLYILTDLKPGNNEKGKGIYILEYKREGKEPVTLTDNRQFYKVTKNQGDLSMLVAALRRCKGESLVNVYSENKYLATGIQTWLDGWIKKNFEDVKNKDLWKEIVPLMRGHDFKFVQTKEHEYYHWMERQIKG